MAQRPTRGSSQVADRGIAARCQKPVARHIARRWLYAALTALIYGALLTYQLVRLWPQFRDVSVKAEAAHDLKLNSPFRDCANCPWMVVVEEGNFIMGSPSKKKDQGPPSDETPPHKVTFESLFAVGKYEVTFDVVGCLRGSRWMQARAQ